MREYELATERLEILASIHALDDNQEKLADLQKQLSCFEDGTINSLRQLPAIQNGDRSAEALAELKKQLKELKSPFFKEFCEKLELEVNNPDAILADLLQKRAENGLKLKELITEEVSDRPVVSEALEQYLAALNRHFSTYVPLILKETQGEGEARDPIRIEKITKICADFKSDCAKEKEALLSALSDHPKLKTYLEVFAYSYNHAGSIPLENLYFRVVGSKKNEISRNEALDHFSENCEEEKHKIEDGIALCHEKQRECERLQAELKAFDDVYFNHPVIAAVMPRHQLWKLGTDARDHSYGRSVYDEGLHRRIHIGMQEPGYMDGMETALAFVLRSADVDLTTDFIGQVHRIACYFSELPDAQDHQQFYPSHAGYLRILNDFTSEQGIREVAEWGVWKDPNFCLYGDSATLNSNNVTEFLAQLEEKKKLVMGRDGSQNTGEYIGEYIQKYNQWMTEAGDDENKKLIAIAKLCRLIDCSHPFADGNIRTVRLLMLMLMIRNNLTPTMMMDPNIMDGYHSSEIVRAIKEGQHTYELECLLAKNDEPGMKESLKEKIIDQCVEQHGLFILNNEKKLCELFPSHIDLIKARAECARNKPDQGYYKSYEHEKVRAHYEKHAQAAFDKNRSIAENNERILSESSGQTLFGARAKEARASELSPQDQNASDKKPGATS